MPRPTVTGTPLYDLYYFIVPAMTFGYVAPVFGLPQQSRLLQRPL